MISTIMRHARAIAGWNTIVQVIHVTWDKSARGGRLARSRNQVPLALLLPGDLQPQIGRHLLIHESRWGKANEFTNEFWSAGKAVALDEGFSYRGATVTIRRLDTGTEFTWRWNDWEGIRPSRVGRNASHIVVVQQGGWVRIRWNGRFTCIDTGNWWYESVALNIGVHPDADIPDDFFLRSKPADECSKLAHLS
jgi:hypothetical protein